MSQIKNLDKNEYLIHITYNSKELERITDPIVRQSPNSLYYMYHHGENEDINMEHKNKNIALIKEKLPECLIFEHQVNYVDYYSVISNLAEIISSNNLKYPEKTIQYCINIGTGSKMVAVANMDAYRLWDNISLIYPYSLDYHPESETTHSGLMKAADPPKFQFRKPTIKLLQSLQVLYHIMETPTEHGHIRDFIWQYDWQNALYHKYSVAKVKENPDPRKKDSSEKISMDRQIVKKLEKTWKFIRRVKESKSYKVFFTDEGLKMAKLFMKYDYGVKFGG